MMWFMSASAREPKHDMALEIRTLNRNDQAVARVLILDGLREHFDELDETLNTDLLDIYASYEEQGHVFLLACLDGDTVGAGGLIVGEHEGQIVRVSVAASFRRRGIARALVEALVAEAALHDLDAVWMETNHDWTGAIALYRSIGFEPFTHHDDCIFMRKALARATLVQSTA